MVENEGPNSQSTPSNERLESWKEIAAHLKRGVSTVQRWEEQEGLPVHRHLHNKLGSVWASRAEIDEWWRQRQARPDRDQGVAPRAWAKWAAAAFGLVLLLGGIPWVLSYRGRPGPSAPSLPLPLTSLEGRELDPALSPDGHELAMTWDGDGGGFSLYLLTVGNDAPRRLADGPGVCCPSWSPDGRQVAFVRQSGDGGAMVVVPARGGAERTLGRLRPWYGTALAWSADAKRIVYPDRLSPHEPYSLFTLSLETLEVRSITQPGSGSLGDAFPSYSDDGKRLAFARVSASGDSLPAEVYVLEDGDAEARRLTSQGGLIGGLAWAPGGHIVYAAVIKGENPRLRRVSANGDEPPSVLDEPAPSDTVAESPSAVSHALRLSIARGGHQVAYVRRSYDTNIWRRASSAQAGTARRLIASTRPDESPQYSPDGKRIAFASSRSGRPEVWTCRRDGTDCVPLTHAGVHSGTPRWSPDGRRIAIDSRPAGQSDIYVVSVEAGEMSRVTTSPADDVVPSWSRDGRSIYFASNRGGSWQVYRTSVEGAEATQVSVHGGFAAFEGEDAVYFTRHDEPGLWRVPLSGGIESKLLDEPRCWGHWALARGGAYLLNALPGGGTSLDFFDFAQARRAELGTLSETAPCAESSLAVSPEGRELLYVATEETSDIMAADIR